jgi:class 3 adenylate cyclase
MSMFDSRGARTKRLVGFLKRRALTPAAERPALDCKTYPQLFCKRAVVFTDTADFTTRTARHGILHFLMVFERLALAAPEALRESGGEIVKIEGDSLLLRFEDVARACRGVAALETLLAQLNRKRPADECLHFSYGVGYGDVLDLDRDMFGLEVNLASKLGEDLARPGEVLLTPAAAASLDARALKRVVPHQIVTFGQSAIPVQRFKLPRK